MIAKNFCPTMIILHKPLPLVTNYLNRPPSCALGRIIDFNVNPMLCVTFNTQPFTYGAIAIGSRHHLAAVCGTCLHLIVLFVKKFPCPTNKFRCSLSALHIQMIHHLLPFQSSPWAIIYNVNNPFIVNQLKGEAPAKLK